MVEDISNRLRVFEKKYYVYALAINSIVMILLDAYLAYIRGLSVWLSLAIGAFFFIIIIGFFTVVPLFIGKKIKPEDPFSILAIIRVPVLLTFSTLAFTFSILSLTESVYNYVIVFASMGFFTLFGSIVSALRAMGKRATIFAFLGLASLIPVPFVTAASPNPDTSFPPILIYTVGILLILFLAFIAIHSIQEKRAKQ